ncbi:MAG: Stp1/IreP family PP2C-type Ser/Thr phosphatase [Actinomycetota bacterium]
MRVLVGASTDVGRDRERNEDGFLTLEPLFAVADGMGGHRGGAVASRVALEVLGQMEGDSMSGDGVADGLAEMVTRANDAVLERASEEPRLSGMGTTLTAVVVQSGKIHLAHVGDSRAYLLRDGNLRQLTEDHSLVQRMVKEGKLTPQEAEIHPHRSVLTRALGVEPDLQVDKEAVEARTGDRILLCSDGLTTMVPEEEIRQIVAEHDDPQQAADALVSAANQAGGVDNITAVLLYMVDDAQAPDDRTSARPGERAAGAGTRIPPEAAEPVPSTTGRVDRAQRPRKRRRPLRIVAWVVVLAALLGAAFMGARAYAYSQWYVGVQDGRVALFQGMPIEILGYELHRAVEVTDLPAARAMELGPWRDLDQGITAESEQEALAIIATIRQDLAEAERPNDVAGAGSG